MMISEPETFTCLNLTTTNNRNCSPVKEPKKKVSVEFGSGEPSQPDKKRGANDERRSEAALEAALAAPKFSLSP